MTLREELARLEHEQWMQWARSIMQGENISEERKKRWEAFMVPYEDLPENWKEMDRVWADKSIKAVLKRLPEKEEELEEIEGEIKAGAYIRGLHRGFNLALDDMSKAIKGEE